MSHAGRHSGGAAHVLSIAIIDPNLERRNAVAGILCGLRSAEIAPKGDDTARHRRFPRACSRQDFGVVLVAADGNQEAVMKAIEYICQSGSGAAMAYSETTHDDLLIHCMRAGVREFMIYPFAPGVH